MSYRSLRSRALTVALVLVTLSCGGGENRTTSEVSRADVGKGGATLLGPDGAKVVVPADALAGDVTIVVSALNGVRTPRGTALVGQAMRLEPAGTEFDKPVEVTIPISPTALNGMSLDRVVVIRSEQDSDVFVPLPTRRSPDGTAVIAISEHFSDFVPVIIEDFTETSFGACGDDMCTSDESCDTCPYDCGVCVDAGVCGNNVCDSASGENCVTCEYDCGECHAVCNDGFLDLPETCDPTFASGTPLETCATCDDNDPCTTDSQIGGDASTCDVVCLHDPMLGYGLSDCDDNVACTSDVVLDMSPTSCMLTCENTALDAEAWAAIYCDDGNPATTDVAVNYDPATCATDSCSHVGIPAPNTLKHIFLTSATYWGGLGGAAGADQKCNDDGARPTSGVYKALLVTPERIACLSPNCSGGSAALDWVFQPTTTYYEGAVGAETAFSTTDANGLLTFPLGVALGGGVNFWLGMNVDWTPSTLNCLDFTDYSADYTGALGWGVALDTGFINGGDYACFNGARLVCVEQ